MNKLAAGFLLALWSLSAAVSQSKQPVAMLFAGDLTLDRHIEQAAGDDPAYLFQRWDVGPYDLLMVNLENPVTTSSAREEKEFTFRMHPKYLPVLKQARISIVNAANNHIADFGLAGIFDTMRLLDSVDVQYVGIGTDLAHARTPAIIEIKGWKIGFLGYHGARKFAATPTRAGLAPRTLRLILEDVRALKARTDYVVVNFHWGEELATQPDPEQMRFAHQVVDAGADLIVGHHPHVLQGIELYRGATIAYSLGNFLFGGNARHSYDTAVLKVVLNDGGPRVTLVPVAVRRWQPMLADEATTRRVNNLVQERSALFRRPFPISTNTSE